MLSHSECDMLSCTDMVTRVITEQYIGSLQVTLDIINQLRLDNVLTDVCLVSGNHHFPCHQAVLAAASPYLRDVLKRQQSQPQSLITRMSFDNIPATTLGQLIEFMYCGKTDTSDIHINNLLQVAKAFELSDLTSAWLSSSKFQGSQEQPVENEDENGSKENRDVTISSAFTISHLSHPHTMMKALNKLRKKQEFTDVVFLVENQKLACHRIVVIPLSSYFQAMFTNNMKESQLHQIEINTIAAETMKTVIKYAYSGKISITNENADMLLEASSLFQILPIQNACITYMQRQMDASNCLGIQAITDVFSCKSLCHTAFVYAIENFDDVCLSEEFLTLSEKRLKDLIKEDLCVNSEEVVYQSLLRWIGYDTHNRKLCFPQLFKCIRLQYISSTYLKRDIMTASLVTESKECMEMIDCFLQGKLSSVPERMYNEIIVNIHGYNYNSNHGVSTLDKIHCYDPRTDKWFELPNFSLDKGDKIASACNVTNNIFVLTKQGKTWLFQSQTKEWIGCTGLFRTRHNHQMVAVDEYVYKLGGQDSHTWSTTVNRYCTLTDSWDTVTPMLGTRCIAATVCNGLIYAVTGSHNGLECYDPKTNTWTQVATLPEPESAQAVSFNSQLYILMHGCNFLCYNLEERQWKYIGRLASHKSRRFACRLAVCNGKIFASGGCDKKYQNINTVDCYNVNTGKWKTVTTMQHAAWGHCCVTLPKYVLM
ncbi:kelch-like protein 24 [Glandiceps talaboti]